MYIGAYQDSKIKGLVAAQLVERSLSTPEDRGSNPVIGNLYIERLLSTVLKRWKQRKKEAEIIACWWQRRYIRAFFNSQRKSLTVGIGTYLTQNESSQSQYLEMKYSCGYLYILRSHYTRFLPSYLLAFLPSCWLRSNLVGIQSATNSHVVFTIILRRRAGR